MNTNDLFKSWENAIDKAISRKLIQNEISQVSLTRAAAVNVHTNLKAGQEGHSDVQYSCSPWCGLIGPHTATYGEQQTLGLVSHGVCD